MGFTTTAPLGSLIPVEESMAVAEEITQAAGEFYFTQVRELTPEYKGPATDQERGGRKPGTARDSVRLGPVVALFGDAFSVTTWSDDPVMEFIEWDTVPHMIRPTNAEALRWPNSDGSYGFASEVSHPGTTGVHMFEITATALEAELATLAAPILAAWEADTLVAAVA